MSATLHEKVLFESEQIVWNTVVWGAFPAAFELTIESTGGGLTTFVVATAAIEQFIENRIIERVPTKARRIVPLLVTSAVMTCSLLCLHDSFNHLQEVASISALSSLSFAFIKSVVNKPYPSIASIAKYAIRHIPVIGPFYQEKPKLF